MADLLEADGDVSSSALDNATSTLDGATDTNITSVADNDLLAYDSASSKWINQSASEAGITSTINGATDTVITSIADNDLLAYDTATSKWINQSAAEAGLVTSSGVTSVATGSGLTGGTITSTGTLSHADTSSQASVNNSGRTYIQDITLDDFGHVTGLTSATETVVNTDTNTTYSAGRGLSLSGTTFNFSGAGSGPIKQLILNSPNPGVISKSGGWSEVTSSLRTSITCGSASSRLLICFTFVYGGNNNSQIGAFKIRDITGNFDVNMSNSGNRSASHGTTRHKDHDVNDVEMITVAAVVESGQTSTSSRTYSLYHKNEGNGGVAKYFFGWGQNLSQGFYAKPVCHIYEI
jgi:hypothetical protein